MANSPSTETTEKPIAVKALPRTALALHESRNCNWSLVVPHGTTREMLLVPALYATIAEQLHPMDELVVQRMDRAFIAKLLVLDCGRGYANIVELSYHPLPALLVTSDGLPPGYAIEFMGPVDTNGGGGYCARRIADGVLICKGHSSRDECLAALLDHRSLD